MPAAGKLRLPAAEPKKQNRLAMAAEKGLSFEARIIILQIIRSKTDPACRQRLPEPPAVASRLTPNQLMSLSFSKWTTTQWLSVISIIVSLVGIYYKRRRRIKVILLKTPKKPQAHTPPPSPVLSTSSHHRPFC